ncbi:MAG: serine--tRNA ligase [bacterium]
MLDAKLLREAPDKVKQALKNRGYDTSLVDKFSKVDEIWRKATFDIDKLKAERNAKSQEIPKLKAAKKDSTALMAEMKKLSDLIAEKEEKLKEIEKDLNAASYYIPNIPHESVPVGKDASCNIEIRKWGQIKKPGFVPKSHDELGEKLGILSASQGAKIAGSRFTVYRGLGAKLEWALVNFMRDVQTNENGYTEVIPPFLTTAECAVGTGQLPKFEDDLYKCSDNMYLAPTAEVPVTNIHRDEILDGSRLPIKYAAYTPCFRREAGSYGKDVKGLIRQHQFNKVEIVKFVEPSRSYEELESLTADAEKILQKLGLSYRVVALCTGDMGFSASKTYDIEVWFPSENKYREISSCSNFENFQARRANIKFRKDAKTKPEFVHTLNGSGLAVGRTFAAVIENYQEADGSVNIPEALISYMGGVKIIK